MVLSSPAFDKAHADNAHLAQLIYCLVAVVDRLGQKSGKLLIVEDFQAAGRGNLAHSGWVKAVRVITVPALNEDAALT